MHPLMRLQSISPKSQDARCESYERDDANEVLGRKGCSNLKNSRISGH